MQSKGSGHRINSQSLFALLADYRELENLLLRSGLFQHCLTAWIDSVFD